MELLWLGGRFERDGGSHAERRVLNALRRSPAPDAVMYVTLEPCSTRGRTAAWGEATVASGLGKVVLEHSTRLQGTNGEDLGS